MHTESVPVQHPQQKLGHLETALGIRLQTNPQVEDLNTYMNLLLLLFSVSLCNREHNPQNYFIHCCITTYIFHLCCKILQG